MRLRSFSAATMTQVMTQVREELGPDAIIVSTRHGENGGEVQVTAAVEPAAARQDEHAVSLETRLEADLRRRLRHEAEVLGGGPLETALRYHGLPEASVQQLVRSTASLDAESPVLALAGALDIHYRFAPLAEVQRRPLMVIGPPGTGKTVTLVKIAARAALAGVKVKLAALGEERAGAFEQLETFARTLDCKILKATAPLAAAEALADCGQDEVMLFDSPGIRPFSSGDKALLQGFIQCTKAEPVLVLAAGTDPGEAAEHGEIFAALGAKRLITTRLDASRRLGGMLTAAATGHLGIADVGVTPYVADGLRPINPVALSRLCLNIQGDTERSGSVFSNDSNEATA